LKVNPSELRVAADKIDGHAADFAAAHQAAHRRAGDVALGSGVAGAALPQMMGAWDSDGTEFAKRFTAHAEGHRAAANAYMQTDDGSANRIGDAGSAF
jgi:uncharacterized protein YukE